MSSDVPASPEQVIEACERGITLAPFEYLPDMPAQDALKALSGLTQWHPFEHEAWQIGERIRRAFVQNPKLKKNGPVLEKVVEVAICRNLRRGRQSFIMALGFVAAVQCAKRLAPFLSDADVGGQVLYTLIKMHASGFAPEVEPLLQSDKTWIRNLAKKYLGRYCLPSF